MIWLFHRRGEYVTCEVRTCLEDAGFELLMTSEGRSCREWYADASEIERRWQQVRSRLDREGWGDVYERWSAAARRNVTPPRRCARA
ncbi:MAG TPA: hypothetical protein VD833_23205 [Vicinamibacterales bacterium]|nr:hypothetical protein [Vicinamibacterales bacterium]